MSGASVGLICVSVLGTSSPAPCPFPLLLLLLSLPPAVLIPISLSYALFFSLYFFLHTRKNQEKKGLNMVTSKLVVRLPPNLHTPSPFPLDSFCWTRTKTKSGKVDGFLCCGSCCCWCFSAAAFAVDFPLYLYTNFLFALLFFSSTHFLSLRSSSFLFARNFRC